MDDDNGTTRHLHMKSVLLGAYPYVLVQIEPTDDGGKRLCIDYELLSLEEVGQMLREALTEVEMNGWMQR